MASKVVQEIHHVESIKLITIDLILLYLVRTRRPGVFTRLNTRTNWQSWTMFLEAFRQQTVQYVLQNCLEGLPRLENFSLLVRCYRTRPARRSWLKKKGKKGSLKKGTKNVLCCVVPSHGTKTLPILTFWPLPRSQTTILNMSNGYFSRISY